MIRSDIFVIFHHLVDDTVRSQLDNAVGNRLNKFVVMRREEDISLVRLQVVVESLNRFQVQVIGRSIQNQTVRIAELHTCNHTTHLFTSGKYADFLQYLFAGEQHTSEETLHVYFVTFAELAQPVHQIEISVEEVRIVNGQIGRCDGHTPVELSGIRLHVSVDDFEESGHRTRIA